MKKNMIGLLMLTLILSFSVVFGEQEEVIFENGEHEVKAYREKISQDQKDSPHFVDARNFSSYKVYNKITKETVVIELTGSGDWWDTGHQATGTLTDDTGRVYDLGEFIDHHSSNAYSLAPSVSFSYMYAKEDKEINETITIRNYKALSAPYVEVYWANRSYTTGKHQLDFDVMPQVLEGRTMIPIRQMMEKIDYQVSWEPSTSTVVCKSDAYKIDLQLNNKNILVTDLASGEKKSVVSDVAPQVLDGRTMVPLRALAEISGLSVYWNPIYKLVHIEGQPPSDMYGSSKGVTIDFQGLGLDPKPAFDLVDEKINLEGQDSLTYRYSYNTGETIDFFGQSFPKYMYGLADPSGKKITPALYTYLDGLDHPYVVAADDEDKYGLINKAGKVLIAFEYDYISRLDGGGYLLEKDQSRFVYKPQKGMQEIMLNGYTFSKVANRDLFILSSDKRSYLYDMDFKLILETDLYALKGVRGSEDKIQVWDKANIHNGSTALELNFDGSLSAYSWAEESSEGPKEEFSNDSYLVTSSIEGDHKHMLVKNLETGGSWSFEDYHFSGLMGDQVVLKMIREDTYLVYDLNSDKEMKVSSKDYRYYGSHFLSQADKLMYSDLMNLEGQLIKIVD